MFCRRQNLFLIVLLSLGACKSSPPQGHMVAIPNPEAVDNAHQVADNLALLLPLVLDPVQFNLLANQEAIDQTMNRLARFHHNRELLKDRPSDDPAIRFLNSRFSETMMEARTQLNLGNRSYSRFLVRGAVSSCVACHAEGARASNFLKAPGHLEGVKLTPLDRANYFFSVHNADAGMKQYQAAIAAPSLSKQPYASLEATALKALATAVRVNKDPVLSETIVTRIANSAWAPESLRHSALAWKQSIHEWAQTGPKAMTLNEVKELLAKVAAEQNDSPLMRVGLIELLRASSAIHDLLDQPKRGGKVYTETLYLAGVTANALRDLDPFGINDAYFEACIELSPHTKMAKTCYLKLEGALLMSYKDWDARPLPENLLENLQALRRTAEPSERPTMEWGQQHD